MLFYDMGDGSGSNHKITPEEIEDNYRKGMLKFAIFLILSVIIIFLLAGGLPNVLPTI